MFSPLSCEPRNARASHAHFTTNDGLCHAILRSSVGQLFWPLVADGLGAPPGNLFIAALAAIAISLTPFTFDSFLVETPLNASSSSINLLLSPTTIHVLPTYIESPTS